MATSHDLQVRRRDVLRGLAAGTVGAACSSWVDALTLVAQSHGPSHRIEAAAAVQNWAPKVLNAEQNQAVIILTELIIPETDTPGAKAALVNRFVDRVLSESRPADREKFLAGLTWLNDRCRELHGRDIVSARDDQRTALLTSVSDEHERCTAEPIGCEFFRAIKAMTIKGYYSTEIGLRKELGDDGQLYLQEFAGCEHPEHSS